MHTIVWPKEKGSHAGAKESNQLVTHWCENKGKTRRRREEEELVVEFTKTQKQTPQQRGKEKHTTIFWFAGTEIYGKPKGAQFVFASPIWRQKLENDAKLTEIRTILSVLLFLYCRTLIVCLLSLTLVEFHISCAFMFMLIWHWFSNECFKYITFCPKSGKKFEFMHILCFPAI